MSPRDVHHYETNLECLKIGDFYTKTIFLLQAESVFKDFAAALKPSAATPGVPAVSDFHQNWLKGTIDRNNQQYHLRLGRAIGSHHWTFILEKKILCFEAEFFRLRFDLMFPARGPGGYFMKVFLGAPANSSFELSCYAESSFNTKLQVNNRDLGTTVELKELSDFLNCYYELNLGNDV